MRYQPSDPDDFRSLVEALPFDLTDYVFVDLGSGKGRILLLASRYPFRGVVGVEFAHELNEVAERNIALSANHRRRCHDVRTVTAGARVRPTGRAARPLPLQPVRPRNPAPDSPSTIAAPWRAVRGPSTSSSPAREARGGPRGPGSSASLGGEGEGRGIFAFADAPGARARPKSEPRPPRGCEGEYFDGQDIGHIGKNNWSDSRWSWTSAPARPSRASSYRNQAQLGRAQRQPSYWDWRTARMEGRDAGRGAVLN